MKLFKKYFTLTFSFILLCLMLCINFNGKIYKKDFIQRRRYEKETVIRCKKIIIHIPSKIKRLSEKNTRMDEKNTHDKSVVLGTIGAKSAKGRFAPILCRRI